MGSVGDVWVDIGGDASQLKRAAQESIDYLERLKKVASEQLGLGNVSNDFVKLNQGLLQGFSQTNQVASSTTSSINNLALSFTGLNQAMALVQRGAKAIEQAWDFLSEGAQLSSMEMAAGKLATAYNTDMANIVASIKYASFNTVTEYDAIKAASLAMTMGVSTSAEEIANLMQIAIERGRTFGMTAEQSFDVITRGIGRRSTRILDDLGFAANAIQANKDYAASLGISTSALTDEMKVRALFEQILKQGNAELEKQGGLEKDISTVYERATAKRKEFINKTKTDASVLFATLWATKEEMIRIDEQYSQSLIESGGRYSDYVLSQRRKANMEGKQQIVAGETYYTKDQYNMLVRLEKERQIGLRAKTPAGYGTPGWNWSVQANQDYAESISFLNEEMALEIGLSNQLAEAQDKYATAMSKAGNSTEKQRTAISDLRNTYESFVLETVQSLGADTSATMSLAYAFGDIDKTSLGLFSALEQLTSMAEDGSIGWDQWAKYVEKATSNAENLAKLQIGDKHATFTIDFVINYITRGTPLSGLTFSGIPTSEELGISLQNRITKKHGGSFVGLAHGGIVPPGYSNDGMPIWVSSGERVDVTPAGNKTINGENGAQTVNRFYAPVTLQIDKTTAKDIMRELRL